MSTLSQATITGALRHGELLVQGKVVTSPELQLATMLELANLGFRVDDHQAISGTPEHLELVLESARDIVGSDRDMTPIYPGFPKQVQELHTMQLLVEQLLHYWTFGAFLPQHDNWVRENLPVDEVMKANRHLRVTSDDGYVAETLAKIVEHKTAMSPADQLMLAGLVSDLDSCDNGLLVRIAANSSNGENLFDFAHQLVAQGKLTRSEAVILFAPTASNVSQLLRVILAAATLNSEHIAVFALLHESMARHIRLGSLSKQARRVILSRLGEISEGYEADALLTKQYLWRRVMRGVHPYSFKLDETTQRAVDIIHGNTKHTSFNSGIESAIRKGDLKKAVQVAKENPGNFLRRLVALARVAETRNLSTAAIAAAVREVGPQAQLSTLISAYNGLLSANASHPRIVKVPGKRNHILNPTAPVSDERLARIKRALTDAIGAKLAVLPAPSGVVGVKDNTPVSLVARDLAIGDREMLRGSEFSIEGEGGILRVFGHWNNNREFAGYMDVGVAILDSEFAKIETCDWRSWNGPNVRKWGTYSGDCRVYPGNSAAEFIDVDLKELREIHPEARYVVGSVQSWSGWPTKDVDFIGGVMFRKDGQKGEVFDPRTVKAAFKPTTPATQSLFMAVDLECMKAIWMDASSGSSKSSQSVSNDHQVGLVTYDAIGRERLTYGELAKMWAKAHGVKTKSVPVDLEQLREVVAL